MLDSLYIKNFRLFKELEIDNLKRINLFVGKNNTGKTCLLEAIEAYACKFENLNEMVIKRDEGKEYKVKPTQDPYKSPVRFLFNDNKLNFFGENDIEIGKSINDPDKIIVRPRVLTIKNGGYGDDIPEEELDNIERNSIQHIYLIGVRLGILQTDKNAYIYDHVGNFPIERRTLSIARENIINFQFARSDRPNHQENIELWGDVALIEELASRVIEAFQIIEPRTTGFTYKQIQNESIPFVGYQNKEAWPLKTYGEGMTHLLEIILKLVNAKDGILLIDEAENGLHWSVQPKLWEIIFQMAEKLNVQVFATTHSIDCVKGFNEVWSKYEDLGCFYRLERNEDGQIDPVFYFKSTLSATLNTGVEFR